MQRIIRKSVLSSAIAIVCTQAYAQDEKYSEEEWAALGLEEVVVTGVARAGGASQMDTSVSTSVLSSADIAKQAPRTTGEILRNIPGVRAESSGGDGNSNINMRGLPAPDGGARYVSVQEDGLPIMMFGDMNFGPPDTFYRADSSIARLESVRGGSASTLASNAPGGIINFVSQTGEEEGGSVSIGTGLDYDEFRADFSYGGYVSDTVRFFLGGYTRSGEGPREVGYNAHSGGQIKFNITKEYDNGYIRFNMKKLEDRALAVFPSALDNEGEGLASGYDSDDLTQTPYLTTSTYIDREGNVGKSDIRDGMHPIVDSWGFEANFDLGGGWTVDARHRTQDITGGFVGTYYAGLVDIDGVVDSETGDVLGTYSLAGGEIIGGSGFRYVNGPNEGQAYTGSAADIKVFDVTYNDMGNEFTDVKFTKDFDERVYLTLGVFKGTQSFDQEWHWSSYLTEAKGDEAALIDIVDDSGNALTDGGLAHYGANWGGCCNRVQDLEFENLAPYAAVEMIFGDLSVDVSLRQEIGSATGSDYFGVEAVNVGDVNRDGTVSAVEENAVVTSSNPTNYINWDYNETSWSGGVNYRLTEEHAIFGRASQGARINADRVTGQTDPAGNISDDALRDVVNQYEFGYKLNLDSTTLFVTYFFGDTTLTSYDFTLPNPNIDQDYDTSGVEVEFSTQFGNFGIDGWLAWIDSEISSGANEGNTPKRQADIVYSLTGTYDADMFSVGAQVIGTTDSYAQDDNATEMPGFQTVGVFADYYATDSLTFSLNVNNMFDEFGGYI